MPNYNSKMHIVTWLKGVLPYLSNEMGVVPTIKILATMKGCSQATMHKAIKELEEEGVLVSKRGYGTCLKNLNFHTTIAPSLEVQKILQKNISEKENPRLVLILPVFNYSKPPPNIVTGYLTEFCQGVLDACEKYKVEVVIKYFDVNTDNRIKSIRAILAYIKKSKVRYLMTGGVVGHDLFLRLSKTKLPCLIVDHWPLGLHLPSLNPNHFDAAKELVFVLASLKHKNIALIDRFITNINPKIMSGYKAGLAETQLEFREELVLNVKLDFLVRWDEDKVLNLKKLLLSKNRPTAFIAYSSEIAIELIKLLERLGLKVPQDVSIVAFCSGKVEIDGVALSGILYDWKTIGLHSVSKLLNLPLKNEEVIVDDYFKYTFLPGRTISFNSFKP